MGLQLCVVCRAAVGPFVHDYETERDGPMHADVAVPEGEGVALRGHIGLAERMGTGPPMPRRTFLVEQVRMRASACR
ncbi:hypothetical protein Taro_009574 [Colocasia esculenta]|uniref:Uncharacterized protein n=1 Tax=Colocasia esculenta TaxID=4460 RepID=A0A843U644_COLES|nr:hypothetical protein [Colocasia esculenta]